MSGGDFEPPPEIVTRSGPRTPPHGARLAYRADIEGLRAIAVIPVVLYHTHVRGFSGGFVGVDIFFVISGYLITGILIREMDTHQYSIGEFYRRRILRIFPALIFMLLVTTVFSYAWLTPPELDRYAESLAGTALFASNIIFYWRTNYFNLGAVSAPLVHTWSLAVEEQWYIIWPLLLVSVRRLAHNPMIWFATAITFGSFASSVWNLPRDAAGTFYLLPGRAWELGLGATLAMMKTEGKGRRIANMAGMIGLLLIAASVKIYTEDMNFPSAAALPPCVGAALMIWSGEYDTWTRRLLALSPLRFFGAISYSLYLWHWPVIAFAQTGLFLDMTPFVICGVLAVSVALATLSWRYLERPFLAGSRGWSTGSVLGMGGVVLASILGLALFSPVLGQWAAPFTSGQTQTARYLEFDGDHAYRSGSCFVVGPRARFSTSECLGPHGGHRPRILLVGDSHAAQLWPGLSRYRGRFDILQATATGCVAKIYSRPYRGYCEAVINAALVDLIRVHHPAALILASRWQARWLDGLEASLHDPAVRAAHPILIGPIPEYSTALPRLLIFAERRHDPTLVKSAQVDEVFQMDKIIRNIALRTGTPYVSLVDLLCSDRVCRTWARTGVPLQFDYGHLTDAGSEFVVDRLMPDILRITRESEGKPESVSSVAPSTARVHDR